MLFDRESKTHFVQLFLLFIYDIYVYTSITYCYFRSKTSGVRKLEENFVQPKIPKRRRTIAKTHTVQSICNSTPLTNSTVQLLKDSVYENENNINTSHLSQSLPSEEPIIFNFTDIKEEVSSQPYHLDENDSWIG